MRDIYLHPGQLTVSGEPSTVTTILGSCVAVGLWDAETGVGGMNHYLLPHFAGNGSASPRFGNVAMSQLLLRMQALGARVERLRARLFGGACVVEALRGTSVALGPRNVELARRFLKDAGIPILSEDVEGDRGRKLVFRTHDGGASVRVLAGEARANG
jgi:chemotaxis protein CheD